MPTAMVMISASRFSLASVGIDSSSWDSPSDRNISTLEFPDLRVSSKYFEYE